MRSNAKPLRDRTLGELFDGLLRHRRYLSVVVLVLLVTVYFPGEPPTRSRPAAELQASGPTVDDAPARATLAGSGDLPSPRTAPPPAGGEPAPGGFTTPPSPGRGTGPSRPPSPGGQPVGELRCGPDQALPQPVLGPTLEEALEAQQALEDQLGQPAPVNLILLVAEGLDCGYSVRTGVAELLILSDLLSPADTALASVLAPVFRGTCLHVQHLTESMAASSGKAHPGLSRAQLLCDALASGHTTSHEVPVVRRI